MFDAFKILNIWLDNVSNIYLFIKKITLNLEPTPYSYLQLSYSWVQFEKPAVCVINLSLFVVEIQFPLKPWVTRIPAVSWENVFWNGQNVQSVDCWLIVLQKHSQSGFIS